MVPGIWRPDLVGFFWLGAAARGLEDRFVLLGAVGTDDDKLPLIGRIEEIEVDYDYPFQLDQLAPIAQLDPGPDRLFPLGAPAAFASLLVNALGPEGNGIRIRALAFDVEFQRQPRHGNSAVVFDPDVDVPVPEYRGSLAVGDTNRQIGGYLRFNGGKIAGFDGEHAVAFIEIRGVNGAHAYLVVCAGLDDCVIFQLAYLPQIHPAGHRDVLGDGADHVAVALDQVDAHVASGLGR